MLTETEKLSCLLQKLYIEEKENIDINDIGISISKENVEIPLSNNIDKLFSNDINSIYYKLKLGKEKKLNENIRYDLIPNWVQGNDFLKLFLPYLKVIGDSREQDKWIESACEYYGIAFEWAKKDKKAKTENLKEGDYTFKVIFGEREFDFVGVVAYERKGSVAEFYGNCTGQKKAKGTSDRERIKREFDRFAEKGYKKVVLMLEFGEKLTDLIGLQFEFRGEGGKLQVKNTFHTIYSAVMS